VRTQYQVSLKFLQDENFFKIIKEGHDYQDGYYLAVYELLNCAELPDLAWLKSKFVHRSTPQMTKGIECAYLLASFANDGSVNDFNYNNNVGNSNLADAIEGIVVGGIPGRRESVLPSGFHRMGFIKGLGLRCFGDESYLLELIMMIKDDSIKREEDHALVDLPSKCVPWEAFGHDAPVRAQQWECSFRFGVLEAFNRYDNVKKICDGNLAFDSAKEVISKIIVDELVEKGEQREQLSRPSNGVSPEWSWLFDSPSQMSDDERDAFWTDPDI